MKRKTPLRSRNPARKAREFARTYGSAERVQWVRRQPCVACGQRPCENAHVTSGGARRKADACWIVPLCWNCHGMLHRAGVREFERMMGAGVWMDRLEDCAVRVEAEWQARQ